MRNISQSLDNGVILTKADGSSFTHFAIPELQEGRRCANYSCCNYEATKTVGIIKTNLGLFEIIECLGCGIRFFPKGTKWQNVSGENLTRTLSTNGHCPCCKFSPKEDYGFYRGTVNVGPTEDFPRANLINVRFHYCTNCNEIYCRPDID